MLDRELLENPTYSQRRMSEGVHWNFEESKATDEKISHSKLSILYYTVLATNIRVIDRLISTSYRNKTN